MRLKILTAIISILFCISLFAQKSRTEFFKEFYGTYLNSTDIEIIKDDKVVPTVDLSDVIKQLELRYNIDIPAEEEIKFKSVEEVAEYVNLYLQKQTSKTESTVKPTDKPEVESVKPPVKVKKNYSWKYKLYGSYGSVEPVGVTGNLGWDGNLFGGTAFNLFGNMYTWETGLMVHKYGWTGKRSQSPNSFGISFDYASFDHWGTDTTWAAYPNDTTATRYAISLVFQQDLTGKDKVRPKMGFYLQESIRVGVHSYGHYDTDLWGNNHLSYGLGFAQGFYFLIFDLKFYQTIAYSPDIMAVRPDLSIIRALDMEIGLRLGVALKF
ncbi:MAG: hypothetical protein U9O95_00610 [Candidatus Marinimicrobia bacterium]|nr:hypothetical protein [Candidatus Neomarinimicrobiota bacterium]